ncbi:hypothetical protein N8873_04490, partial [Flavobacteriaceae bacterium]|nr:hypothetical protein [Flavobacteriaceae bacterium]
MEGTLDTAASSVTYELCATNPVTLDIVLENFSATSDTVSRVTILITGVNSLTSTEFTISSTLTLPGSSTTTVTFPDDFTAPIPASLSFLNQGISTVVVSTSSVSGTGDTDTDNDAFDAVANVLSPDTPSLSSPQSGAACAGEEISFAITPTGATEYKFYVNGVLKYSGTNNEVSFSTDPADLDRLSDDSIITIGFTDANGCEADTSTISYTVDVYALPTAALSAGVYSNGVCAGDSVTFEAGGGTNYEFLKGGVVVQAKSTSNTYTTSSLTDTQSVTVVVYNANDCTDEATLAMEVLDVSTGGTVTLTVAADANICEGAALAGSISSTAVAVGTDTITYQWQSSLNGTAWSDIENENSVNFSPPVLSQTTIFRRLAIVSNGVLTCDTPDDFNISNSITIVVDAAFDLSLTTAQTSYCVDDAITFSATSGLTSYTFLINGVSAQASTSAFLVATVSTTTSTSSLTVKNDDIITVIAEDSNGCTVSNTFTVVANTTPIIATLDTDITGNIICENETVVLTAGGGSSYSFTLGGLAPQGGEVSGNVFTTSRITDGAVVEVTVTNASGCTASTSMTFEVVSLISAGTVTITTPDELQVCYNTTLTGTLSSTAPATATDAIHYQWQSSTDGTTYVDIAGENNLNLDLSTLGNLTTSTYFQRQSFAYIDANSSGALDNGEVSCDVNSTTPITIVVDGLLTPTITSSTGGFTFCADAQVTFSADPTNQATYTWTYYNGTSTTSSTGDSTGTATDVTIVANGWIKLEVVTSAGCSYSTTQSITLAGVINTALTAPTTICPSESATISVVATAQATYTFYIGGAVVQDGSSNSLTTTGITRTSSVVVVITNATGCSETVSTTIAVVDLADGGDISLTPATICSGDSNPAISSVSSATLESYSSATSITYFWERSYDQASWSLIPNEEEVNLSAGAVTNIVSTTYFRRGALIENEQDATCETLYSNNTITLTVEDAISPTITSSTGGFTFCADAQVTFSADPTNQATYTWTYYNGTSTTSSTGDSTGTATDVTIVANGWIKLEVVTSAGCSYSTTQSITLAGVINTALTAPTTICPSESATISVVATAQATYTFYIGGAVVQDGSSNSLTTTGITRTSSVVVVITNATGCSETVSTTIAVVDLADGGDISLTPATICSGDSNPAISSVSSATLESYSSATSITYFWERSYDQASWSLIPNEEEVNLSAGAVTNIVSTTYFRRGALIENEQDATCETLYSNVVTLVIDDTRTPEIKVNGSAVSSLSICDAEAVTFSADGTLAATDSVTWLVAGTEVASTTVYVADAGVFATGDILTLRIETASGCTYEESIVITIYDDPAINLTTNAAVSHVFCEDDSITLTVTEVASATYYWTRSAAATPNLSDPLLGSPTDTNSLTILASNLADGDIITVTVSYTAACSITDSITINILEIEPGAINLATQYVCEGETPADITNVTSATTNNASATISYRWDYSNDNGSTWNATTITSYTYEFSGGVPESRIYRRVAIASYSGVALCENDSAVFAEVVLQGAIGGSLDVTTETVCYDIGGLASALTVSGASTGTYQWETSTNFTDWTEISGEVDETYTPSITTTGTTYFRRVTSIGDTCSATTDNVFTLIVGDLDGGTLDTSMALVYCNGTQPPLLGSGSSTDGSSTRGVNGYTWEYRIVGSGIGFTEIEGATSRTYQPPPLLATSTTKVTVYQYQRIAYDDSGCESAPTNVVTITIAPEIEVGYLSFENPLPDNSFICSGQDIDNLVLNGATTPIAGVVTYTWESSTDNYTWTEVASSSSNAQLVFGTSNTPEETTYYRVKISSGTSSPSASASTSLNLLLSETLNTVGEGEIYKLIFDGTQETQVITSATISTTDTIGAALAAGISSNDVIGYNATYYADENIIVIDTYTSDISVSLQSSDTLFLDVTVLSNTNSDESCVAYTEVFTINIYESPVITQIGGPSGSQTICSGESMDTITFEVTGTYNYIEINNLDDDYVVTASGSGSATYSSALGTWQISGTTQFSISGTPTLADDESLYFEIYTSGECDDEALFTYGLETAKVPATPDIIYRNNPHMSRALEQTHQIFQNDGTWYNNTVCQDLVDVPVDDGSLTYQFATCYSNTQDMRYVIFDWDITPDNAVQSITYSSNDDYMQAIINVNNFSDTVTFTAGAVYKVTLTNASLTNYSVTYTTTAVDEDDLIDAIELVLEGLTGVSAYRSGDDIYLLSNTSGEAGYFSIQVENPDNGEFLLGSPEYLYPAQNSVISVVFNPDFGTTTPTSTNGVTATLSVRAESSLCDDVFSDWYDVELYVVSDENPAPDLPTLRAPEALSREYCGYGDNSSLGWTDNVPSCEITTDDGNLYTTFYSAAVADSENDYGYLEWKIDNYDDRSTSGATYPGQNYQYNGGIDPEYGIIYWNPGFWGQFDVCVRAVACDGTTDSDGDSVDDEEGWVCTTIFINPEEERPNIFAVDIPTCSIPDAGTVSSTFTSDLVVDWTIQPSAAYTSTSTRTANGKVAFDVIWKPGYSGTAWVTATTQDCPGDPRVFTIRIPDDPSLTLTSTLTTQSVCQGEDIEEIVFNVSGYSVEGIVDSELPEGLTGVYSTTAQIATIKINNRNLWVANEADKEYIMAIDYNDFTYTAEGTESLTSFTQAITTMIGTSNLVGTATSTTSNNSSTITIVGATPGVRFNIASNNPSVSRFSIGQPSIDTFNGTYTITGSISETLTTSDTSYVGPGGGSSQIHLFNVYTYSSGTSCTVEIGEVYINYSPSQSIATTTPTLLTQYVCDGSALEAIDFTLSNGANDYDTPVWYPYEPNGVEFSPESGDVIGVTTTVTLSGDLDTGVTTTTVFYYTLTTTGTTCEAGTISGSIVIYPKQEIYAVAPSFDACETDYISLEYEFEGISALTITSTSTFETLGLDVVTTYSTTPTVELSIVATATSAQEAYQVEIVEEDGDVSVFKYLSVTGAESPTTIAEALAEKIDDNLYYTATASGSVITITSIYQYRVFWVRVNIGDETGTLEHHNNARMSVTDAIAVKGVMTLSGTPTLGLTETTSYSITIATAGSESCSSTTVTTVITLNPAQFISLTSSDSTLNQEVCEGSAIESTTFYLGGAATGYTYEWHTATPSGLSFSPTSDSLAGTSTVTLAGTLATGVTTTTTYYYT